MTAASASWIGAAQALALDAAAVDTIRRLEAADIDVLLIKGPVTGLRLYPGSPGARNYCDVDLLVAPDNFAAAQHVLAGNGYEPGAPGVRPSEIDDREVKWYYPGDARLPIDLHRSLGWVGDPLALWDRLWTDRTSMSLQGAAVQVPDVAGSALVLALHASRAGRAQKPYRDLARAVVMFDDAHWRRAIETARACDAMPGFALGLDAVPEARPLLARFDLPITARPAMLVAASHSQAGSMFGAVMRLRGRRAVTRYLIDMAFPSVARMHQARPASRAGRLALARAYGHRWLRAARTLPRGLVDLRQARNGGPAGRDDWTADALLFVRAELATTGIGQTNPFRAPRRKITESSVGIVLERNAASCLERSLVRQRFYAAHGQHRELIIGVSPPNQDFHAHAWLSGDAGEGDDLYQIMPRNGDSATSP